LSLPMARLRSIAAITTTAGDAVPGIAWLRPPPAP
jgi:hypothetical protein